MQIMKLSLYTHTHNVYVYVAAFHFSGDELWEGVGGGELYYILVNIVCTMCKGHTKSERTRAY